MRSRSCIERNGGLSRMREIIFRGKHIHAHPKNEHLDGTWVYGYLCNENYINSMELEGEFLIDPETVCQYTGLTDREGKKIFEGDIVRRSDLHNAKEPSIGFIEYDTENTSFLIHWTDIQNYSATFPWKDRIEVIGNIFDNPELIGG